MHGSRDREVNLAPGLRHPWRLSREILAARSPNRSRVSQGRGIDVGHPDSRVMSACPTLLDGAAATVWLPLAGGTAWPDVNRRGEPASRVFRRVTRRCSAPPPPGDVEFRKDLVQGVWLPCRATGTAARRLLVSSSQVLRLRLAMAHSTISAGRQATRPE
jgi:hypothetical protein